MKWYVWLILVLVIGFFAWQYTRPKLDAGSSMAAGVIPAPNPRFRVPSVVTGGAQLR